MRSLMLFALVSWSDYRIFVIIFQSPKNQQISTIYPNYPDSKYLNWIGELIPSGLDPVRPASMSQAGWKLDPQVSHFYRGGSSEFGPSLLVLTLS
jgi:hypothetical protein